MYLEFRLKIALKIRNFVKDVQSIAKNKHEFWQIVMKRNANSVDWSRKNGANLITTNGLINKEKKIILSSGRWRISRISEENRRKILKRSRIEECKFRQSVHGKKSFVLGHILVQFRRKWLIWLINAQRNHCIFPSVIWQ